MTRPHDLQSLRAAVRDGRSFHYLHFWGHRANPAGVGPTCMSQWYPANFVADGDHYATAEHWMMAGKARLFDDGDALVEILASTDPKHAKALGRAVRGFDADAWNAHRCAVVVEGNLHKFRAHEPLRRYLLGTGDAVLVEASPRDRIWGIGMGAKNPSANDPLGWRGQNLLGFCLMEVRDALVTQAEESS